MTTHIHVYCDRCGSEIARGAPLLVLRAALNRDASNAHVPLNPTAPLAEKRDEVDLCERCTTSFRGWLGEAVSK